MVFSALSARYITRRYAALATAGAESLQGKQICGREMAQTRLSRWSYDDRDQIGMLASWLIRSYPTRAACTCTAGDGGTGSSRRNDIISAARERTGPLHAKPDHVREVVENFVITPATRIGTPR